MRVLVVEDEKILADTIATGLRRESIAVDIAYDGSSALAQASVNAYDVIILDRDLPQIHGDEVCQRLIAEGNGARIIMLTAAGDIGDRVEGLRLGADDYLPKPFGFSELVARVRALSRRPSAVVPPILSRRGVRLDPSRREVHRDGKYVPLRKKEFAILEELLRADGAVVSTEHLLEKVWDENADPFTNVVRVTLMNLRKRLGEPAVIETVPGVGYQLP